MKKKVVIITTTCITPVIMMMYDHSSITIHCFQLHPFQLHDEREQIGVFPLDLVVSFGEYSTVNGS